MICIHCIIMAIVCLFGAGSFNAIMDISNFKPHRFERKWWRHDWTRKYVNGDPQQGRVKWFGRINKPVQLIDGFHFSKFIMVFLLVTGILFALDLNWWQWLIGYGVGYVAWNGSFMLVYKYIL